MPHPPRWWLYGHHTPIARLIPTSSDFPWHYFRLDPLPRFKRYAPLFALEWTYCQYAFDEFRGTLRYTVALKLLRYIKCHTSVLDIQPGTLTIWHDYYAHSDGHDIWFKYGTWYQKYPRVWLNPARRELHRDQSLTRRYIRFDRVP